MATRPKKPRPKKEATADLEKLATEAVIESRKGRARALDPEALSGAAGAAGADSGPDPIPFPSPKQTGKKKGADKEEGRSRISARAVKLALEVAEPWKDPDGKAYLDIREKGIRRTVAVSDARSWLSGTLYKKDDVALSGQAANEAMAILEAIAYNDGPTREIYTRIAHHNGEIYLDLGDETWSAVRIYAGGWEVVKEPPVRFRRANGIRALPMPVRHPDAWETFRSMMHEPEEESLILIIAWLIGCFGDGDFPILALSGEQGTGKTTQGRFLRSLVDPSSAPLRSLPDNEEDLMISLRNSFVLAFDNLSYLSRKVADTLARISTGGGYATREKYTNEREVIFSGKRPMLTTSIVSLADKEDLADRTIPVRLPVIPPTARRTAKALQAVADEAVPGILAALLDAVATGLQRLPDIRLPELPRMADFAVWVVACEPALPWEAGRFLEVYGGARDSLIQEGIAGNLFLLSLVEFVDAQTGQEWSGSVSDLLAGVDGIAGYADTQDRDGKVIRGRRKPDKWPQNPQALRAELSRIAPLLRAVGIEHSSGNGGGRTVRTGKTRRAVHSLKRVASGPEDVRGSGGCERIAEDPLFDDPPPQSPITTPFFGSAEDAEDVFPTKTFFEEENRGMGWLKGVGEA